MRNFYLSYKRESHEISVYKYNNPTHALGCFSLSSIQDSQVSLTKYTRATSQSKQNEMAQEEPRPSHTQVEQTTLAALEFPNNREIKKRIKYFQTTGKKTYQQWFARRKSTSL